MRYLAALFCAVLVTVHPAVAEKAAGLDADAAYVLIEVQHIEDVMMKGTKTRSGVTLARYDPVMGDVRGGDLSPDTALPAGQPVRVGTVGKPVAKDKATRLYVLKVEPDTWIVEGANGTAFSLGSMMFTVAPRQVVDLGVFKPAIDWAEGERPKNVGGAMMGAILFGSLRSKEIRPVRVDWHARGIGDLPLPPMLAGRIVAPATFEPNRKFGNYLGGLVNRFGGRAARPDAAGGGETAPPVSAVAEPATPQN